MQMPQMPQMAPQINMPQMAPIGEIIWVQNLDQLGALNLPPNTSRMFMNSGEAEFYIVTTDKIGIKSIATYTFAEKPKEAPAEYVTKGELDRFKSDLIEAMREIKNESYTKQQGRGPGYYQAKNDTRPIAEFDSKGEGAGNK